MNNEEFPLVVTEGGNCEKVFGVEDERAVDLCKVVSTAIAKTLVEKEAKAIEYMRDQARDVREFSWLLLYYGIAYGDMLLRQ